MGFYDDKVVVMQAVWLIDRNGSNGFTDPLLTADPDIMLAAAEASQRPSTFYLPVEMADGSQIAGLQNIHRGNNGHVYSKRLDDLGFELEEILGTSWRDAVDDTVRMLQSPQRGARSRPSRLGGSIMTHSEQELGYGWKTRQENYFIDSPLVVIETANQKNTITFDERSGGQISDWRCEIPGLSIDNQLVNLGEAYGRGFQVDWIQIEEKSEPGEFRYQPTQAGDEFSIAKRFTAGNAFPWEYQASPILKKVVTNNPVDGSTTVAYTVFPLIFKPQDHNGGLHKPVAFLGSKMRVTWVFNWNGREGVHKYSAEYFNPVDLPFAPTTPAPGPFELTLDPVLFLIDNQFDQVWVYDAGTDTETHLVQGVDAPSYAGTEDGVTSQMTIAFSSNPFGLITPNPMVSGAGGYIMRDTGTFWGPGQDFAVGQYTKVLENESSTFKRNLGWDYDIVYVNDDGQPQGKNGLTGVRIRAGNVSRGGHPAGSVLGPLDTYVCMGTFDQVKAQMRQLFLDGIV